MSLTAPDTTEAGFINLICPLCNEVIKAGQVRKEWLMSDFDKRVAHASCITAYEKGIVKGKSVAMEDMKRNPVEMLKPSQLAEKRAEKLNDSRAWSVKDALLAALRDIDSQEVESPDMVVIGFRETNNNTDEVRYTYYTAGCTNIQLVGLLAILQSRVIG